MGNHQNVIELNGKRYDASTGRMLNNDKHVRSAAANGGHVIDGVHKPAHTAKPHAIHKPTHTPAHHSVAHKPDKKAHQPAPHHSRSPQRPTTLARQAVNKPSLGAVATEAPPQTLEPDSVAAIIPKTDPTRLSRSKHIKQSSAISRFTFSGAADSAVEKKVVALPVREAPKHAEPTHPKQSRHKPARAHHQSKSEEHFTKAMNQSRAHEARTTHKKPKGRVARRVGVSRRALNFGTAALAGLLLVGFIAYQNIPNLSMRVASSRAGFNAQLPGYQPAGFAMQGPIEYGSGYVTINFQSNSDGRNYHVTQKVSNWTSESLAASFLATNDHQYQTVQDKGKTIYIYGDGNATWVSGGVWYQVEGDSNLNNDQLLKIANSI